MSERVFELRADAAAGLEAVVDLLLVRADVRSVVDLGDAVHVRIAGPIPEISELGVGVVEVRADGPELTGFEGDSAIEIVDDLVVRPPWVERPRGIGEGAIELVVPRAGPFGSGEHGSTRTALELMHACWPAAADARSFLDVGTGSGILSLYAHERGVQEIAACDIEDRAVAAVRELVPGVRAWEGSVGGDPLEARADIVVANLAWRELEPLLDAVWSCWNGRGLVVLAGIRTDEVAAFEQRWPGAADSGVARREAEGYVGFAVRGR